MAALALFLALVLAVSAGHKLVERERMGVAAGRLTGLSGALGGVANVAAAAVEIMAALCLLVPPLQAVGGAIAGALWLAYGVALAMRYGETLDCGCTFAAQEKPVGPFMLARAFGLMLLGGIVALSASAPLDLIAPFAALAFLALYFAANELAGIIIYRKGHAA
ncbi:MAG: hypothetical protein IPN84_06190 [Sphingomonadales bacterium]|jgi:hypothetical protein|nr:hypothetical protein [Sphingomonadales bacterium]